jgi:hypothetical protein
MFRHQTPPLTHADRRRHAPTDADKKTAHFYLTCFSFQISAFPISAFACGIYSTRFQNFFPTRKPLANNHEQKPLNRE